MLVADKDREFHPKIGATAVYEFPPAGVLLDGPLARTHDGRHPCHRGQDERGAGRAEESRRGAGNARRIRLELPTTDQRRHIQ